MSRSEWKSEVECFLPGLCDHNQLEVEWIREDSPAAVIRQNDVTILHLAAEGVWLMGTKGKHADEFVSSLLCPLSVLRLPSLKLGKFNVRSQDSGIRVIACPLPTDKVSISLLLEALVLICEEVDRLGMLDP